MLTKRQIEILRQMVAAYDRDDFEAAEIVSEGLEVWLGDERISYRTLAALIDHVAVSLEGGCNALGEKFRRWTINETSRLIAKRPEMADKIWLQFRIGKPFTFTAEGDIKELEA